MLSRLIISLLLFLEAGFSFAAQEVPPSETEAARLFREAALEWRELQRSLDDPTTTDIWYLHGAPERVDAASGDQFTAKMQPIIRKVREALAAGPANFPVNFAAGWDMSLPHVAQMRGLVVAMAMDIDWRMHNGNAQGLGADIARMLQLGQSLRSDGTIISSLSEVATFGASAATVDRAIGMGALSPSEARALLETIDRSAAGEGLFGLAEAYENESRRLETWMLGMLDDPAEFMELRDSLINMQGSQVEPGSIDLLLDITPEELAPAIHLNTLAMERAADILRMDDLVLAKEEFQRLSEAVRAGEYGPVAAASGALNANLAQALAQSAELMNKSRAQLALVAASPDGRKSLRNAAIWYRRAIAEWSRLDPDVRKTILGAGGDDRADRLPSPPGRGAGGEGVPPGPAALDLNQALIAAEPVLAILFEASRIERCQFDDIYSSRRFEIWPHAMHLPGMVELGVLVNRAAAHSMESDEAESSAALLTVAIVMCDHLGQDALFESSDAAAEMFASITPLLSEWCAMPAQVAARHEIEGSLARLDPADPFGHRAAIRALVARMRFMLVERQTAGGSKAVLQDRVRLFQLRAPATISPEMVAALDRDLSKIRAAEWPAVRDRLVKLVSAAATDFAAAIGDESLASAAATFAQALESPDVILIRSVAAQLVVVIEAGARAAVAAEAALADLRTALDSKANADG